MSSQAALEIAKRSLNDLTIRSPINGTVLKHNLTVGSPVERGELSIRVANLERMTVVVPIPEAKLPDLKVGLACRVKTSLGDIRGEISEMAPLVEDGSIQCLIVLEPTDLDLLPGMSATVLLQMPDAGD